MVTDTATALQYLRDPVVPPTVAISYPVAGMRVPLPTARWGHVAYDGAVTLWGVGPATATRACMALRRYGVNERTLAELNSPPPTVRDASVQPNVRRAWGAWVQHVATDEVLLRLLVRATRPPKGG